MNRELRHIFYIYHPAVIFSYFCGVLLFCMMTFQPFYVLLSFSGASAYYLYLKGSRCYLKSLRYYLAVLIVVTLLNALFNGLGETRLFSIGQNITITLEALIYGGCAGGMLVSIFLWFSCYQLLMTTDRFLCLFGRLAPNLSMVISMIFRLVPTLVARGHVIQDTQRALCPEENRSVSVHQATRITSVLMGWSMENSLQTADSMRARGYGTKNRTSFHLYRMGLRDWLSLALLALLFGLNCYCILHYANHYLFYPYAALPVAPAYCYVLYAVLLFYPLILQGGEELSWLRSR